MSSISKTYLISLTLISFFFVHSGQAQNQAQKKNTGYNTTAAPSKTGLTPMDQRHGSEQDEEMTRKIRERIMATQDLSVSAQNVKIVTLGKKVNLAGEVRSERELNLLLQAARAIAGNNVTHEIAIRK